MGQGTRGLGGLVKQGAGGRGQGLSGTWERGGRGSEVDQAVWLARQSQCVLGQGK